MLNTTIFNISATPNRTITVHANKSVNCSSSDSRGERTVRVFLILISELFRICYFSLV